MNAHSLFEIESPSPLKLFRCEDALESESESDAETEVVRQRTINPLSNLAEFGRQISQQFAEAKVSATDRSRASTELTMSEFYGRFLRSDRVRDLDPKTVRLDEDALAWFSSVGVPAGWPWGKPWSGPPIACITSGWLDSLVIESQQSGLATNTIGKHLRHLRTMLNAAAKLCLIQKIDIRIPSEETAARPFDETEVELIYHRLAEVPAMQIAFVLAIGTGVRFSDLFWLRWDQIDFEKRQIVFSAEKTDKFQVVPLTTMPLLHLSRLPKHEPPFASLISQDIAAEWRSENYQTRRLNHHWRELTGFEAPALRKQNRPANTVPHPWHSARSTAAVWIETVAAGMASRLLGHTVQGGERVTKAHYLVPLVPADLRAAAEAIMWPDYFVSITTDRPRQQRLAFE